MANLKKARSLNLVTRMRISISGIAGLALLVAGLSAWSLYEIGAEREELVQTNLNTLIELDAIRALMPSVVSYVTAYSDRADDGITGATFQNMTSARLAAALKEIGWRAENLAKLNQTISVAEFQADLNQTISQAAALSDLERDLTDHRAKVDASFAPILEKLQLAEAQLVAKRQEISAGLKTASDIDPENVRQYVLSETALRNFYDMQDAFSLLKTQENVGDYNIATNLFRVRLQSFIFTLARLPESELRQSLVATTQELRKFTFGSDALQIINELIELRARATITQENLLARLQSFQTALSGVAAEQTDLVVARGAALSQKIRLFFGLLITFAIGVLAATVATWYIVLEKGAARRIRKLEHNLQELYEGSSKPLKLRGANDELKRLNDALEELRLQNILRSRMEEDLRLSMQQASADAAAKTHFLSTMSHEVRTPLNAIIGLFELIEIADIPDRQKLRASNGKQAGEKLLDLLNNVLDASRLENNELPIQKRFFHASELIHDIEVALEGASAKHRKTVEGHLGSSIAPSQQLFGDPFRVRQIMYNLIDNAFRFTDSGTVHVEISMDPDQPQNLLLSVKDSGIGIAEDKQSTIFDAFLQIDNGIKRKVGGAGLGLSIARALAYKMGGSLTVSSKLGEGSEFTLRLPEFLIQPDVPEVQKFA